MATTAFSTPLVVGQNLLSSRFTYANNASRSSHKQKSSAISYRPITRPTAASLKPGGDENEPSSSSEHLVLRISRRQAVQLLNGVLGVATLTLLFKMREQFRLISPQAILSSLGLGRLPGRSAVPSALAATPSLYSERVQKAIKYVEMVDRRPQVPCPDFPKGSDWINSRPLSLQKELKGKVVLLDFFTYCCINCQHVLPKLAEIEQRYGTDGSGGVVVVGVHSAKFTAERETKNIAAAVERYAVQHPVLNDEKMDMWNTIGISSWPTLALVGPKGNILAVWSGERQEEDIDSVIAAALEYYSDAVDHRPLPAAPKRNSSLRQPSDSPLRYPGKVALSDDGKTLFVADSGSNRIIQLDRSSGNAVQIFGNGEPGIVDAKRPSEALFHSPQGIVEYDGMLYVADTESHAVRAVDLASGSVETIGGNGEQGFDYSGGNVGRAQQLSSPWDVEVSNGILYVAMAGTHQIWSLTLPPRGKDKVFKEPWKVFSGSGRELEKNSLNGRVAGWAQPSHLSAAEDGMLYVADSESSSVRAVDTSSGSHPTRTIAGGDGLLAENLFAFGDKEGRGARARFQHPLAVCFDDRKQLLYVADSYNHRIKVVDASGSATTFCGSGTPGLRDGSAKEAMFWEPSGLALSPDGAKLYVADTNNCSVRVVDTASKKVSTLTISSAIESGQDTKSDKPLVPNRRRAVQLSQGPVSKSALLKFAITLPEKSHFTPETVCRFQVNLRRREESQGQEVVCLLKGDMKTDQRTGSFAVNLSPFSERIDPSQALEVECVTYYCTEEDDVCRTEADIFNLELSNSSTIDSKTIAHSIAPRKLTGMTA